jgi:hypothetical protein
MPKMSDSELISLLSEGVEQAAIYSGEFSRENAKYLSAYLGEKTGDFQAPPNQSSVVSTDIADVVEADMPSLVRVFLGSGDIITFNPQTDNEVEIEEASEKTKYVNWVVRNQPESFKIIHDWLKDAEIQKNGVVKYFIDEEKAVEEVEYEGVDQFELEQIIESLKGAKVDKVKVEVTERSESEEGQPFDIKFRVTRETERIKIINIPPESFLITRNAESLEEAELVGDRVRKTRGQLVAEGFPRELIDKLPTVDDKERRDSNLSYIRNQDEGGAFVESTINEWASQYVELEDLYVKVDFDGDGIAERRHVMISGNVVLVNEYFNHIPYASLSAVLMPHKAIGRSRAEITYSTQLQKTALVRGVNDNIYMVNNPRNVVHPHVDLDDMLTVRTNGIVRMEDDTNILPQQAVMPLQIPYIGDKALQVIQYVDHARAQTTGSLMANQGLDADKVGKETATRFEGVKDSSDAKIELIARNYAETGFRKLYEGIAWLASRYQNTPSEFRVLGKAMTVNPKGWKYDHHISTNVGLGAGNNEKLVTSLQGIYAIQTQLIQSGSTLSDEADLYNTLKRMVDGLGLPSVQEFFNNPEEPAETLKAENEQLNRMVLQLQEQMQQMQNPLAESEQIKAQATLVKAKGDNEVKMLQAIQDQNQFNATMAQENRQFQEDMAAKLTELELKYNTDVPGSTV